MLNQLNFPIDLNKATQWNKPNPNPLFGRDCNDHPNVRGTSYQEIYHLIRTSGCSNNAEMWDWSVLGIVQDKLGNRLVVSPSDWIIENEMFLTVVPDSVYKETHNKLTKLTW